MSRDAGPSRSWSTSSFCSAVGFAGRKADKSVM
jgi:hypothetical protein